jgi:hypothetical protein
VGPPPQPIHKSLYFSDLLEAEVPGQAQPDDLRVT